jgi:hypothetical protein
VIRTQRIGDTRRQQEPQQPWTGRKSWSTSASVLLQMPRNVRLKASGSETGVPLLVASGALAAHQALVRPPSSSTYDPRANRGASALTAYVPAVHRLLKWNRVTHAVRLGVMTDSRRKAPSG